jgi:inositol-polyphosphate multikinase
MAATMKLDMDASTLKAVDAAAGHDGVLSDASGELLIKPCTQAEIDFYQETVNNHPEFAELIPTFLGTLHLGAPAQVEDIAAENDVLEAAKAQKDSTKIVTETAVVLENLEYGFKQPNVLDLKLGARLYEDSTPPEKAARLDRVAAETTSGSLNFRIAGMKVWNGHGFDLYDKYYGRKFTAENVKDGFANFFSGLTTTLRAEEAAEILETIEAEISKCRHALERAESRMYSASLLIVYEGDSGALQTLLGGEPKTPRIQERAPTLGEVKQSEEEEEEEDEAPVAFKVKMIDFAHATWAPGQGKDDNVIKGLKNIEEQMDVLISRLVE